MTAGISAGPAQRSILRQTTAGSPGEHTVTGTVQHYTGQPLYLFTGRDGRYWPSCRVRPKSPGSHFREQVNLGSRSPTAISLVVVDGVLADYIEHYRGVAGKVEHAGMAISNFPEPLVQVNVVVDLNRAG